MVSATRHTDINLPHTSTHEHALTRTDTQTHTLSNFVPSLFTFLGWPQSYPRTFMVKDEVSNASGEKIKALKHSWVVFYIIFITLGLPSAKLLIPRHRFFLLSLYQTADTEIQLLCSGYFLNFCLPRPKVDQLHFVSEPHPREVSKNSVQPSMTYHR